MGIKEYKLKIGEIIDETDNVKVFRCKIPGGTKIKFHAWQFFMVSIEGDSEKLKRAYSVASSPSENSYIEIALNKVGKFSAKLFNASVGDTLIFKGPYGKLYFSEEMKNDLILIGGGVGITPIMSIIRLCNDKNLRNKINFIYSVRTPGDIIYRNELERIKNENRNFDCHVTITRPENGYGQERTGRIGKKILKENIYDIKRSMFFICGPNEFVKAIIEMLEKLGAKKEQIRADMWG